MINHSPWLWLMWIIVLNRLTALVKTNPFDVIFNFVTSGQNITISMIYNDHLVKKFIVYCPLTSKSLWFICSEQFWTVFASVDIYLLIQIRQLFYSKKQKDIGLLHSSSKKILHSSTSKYYSFNIYVPTSLFEFLTNTLLLTSQDVNWWSHGNYLWIIVMFLSAACTLILTAPIHCRGSIGEQVIILNGLIFFFRCTQQAHNPSNHLFIRVVVKWNV